MTLATILIVLLIDRLLWQGDPLREHRWFDRYSTRLLGLATGQWLVRLRVGAFWFVLPPLLVVALLQWISGNISGLVIGAVVLLFSLGPHDLGRQADAYLAARARDDGERSATLADELGAAPDDDPAEQDLGVAQALLQQSCPRLFGPLFWFVVLGPMGAALYRLTAMTATRSARQEDAPPELGATADRLLTLLDWLPGRLTAAAFAAAGNFDAVSRAWRDLTPGVDGSNDTPALLVATGRAALDSWPDEEELAAGEQPPVVEDALALVWRTLVVWLLALVALTLLATLF